MLKTVYRISVMYFVSIILMRIAGKREVAQLEVSELVTSFMISEIACMPITDPEVPLSQAIVFTLTVIILEILLTKASLKIPFFKHLVVGKPTFIIIKGKLYKKALSKSGVSLSELISSMRKSGVTCFSDVEYAVQEPDGNISIIPCCDDESDNSDDVSGIEHMLVCDGKINKSEAELFGYKENDIYEILKRQGIHSIKGVFYLGANDKGETFIIEK